MSDPGRHPNASDRLAAARARHRDGAVGEAAEIYRDVLAGDPDNPTALHLLGVATLQTGDALGAIALLERARGVTPADADLLNSLGEAQRVAGHDGEAIEAYRAALQVQPAHAAAAANLARVEQTRLAVRRAPAAPPTPSTRARLQGLVNAGRIGVAIDLKRLDSLDSPVVMQSDLGLWFLGLIVVVALAFWFGGRWVGGAVAVVGLGLYQGLGRPYLRRRLTARIRDEALADDAAWGRLWRFGGVRLVSLDPALPGECAAPAGDWLAFAKRFDNAVESRPPTG